MKVLAETQLELILPELDRLKPPQGAIMLASIAFLPAVGYTWVLSSAYAVRGMRGFRVWCSLSCPVACSCP